MFQIIEAGFYPNGAEFWRCMCVHPCRRSSMHLLLWSAAALALKPLLSDKVLVCSPSSSWASFFFSWLGREGGSLGSASPPFPLPPVFERRALQPLRAEKEGNENNSKAKNCLSFVLNFDSLVCQNYKFLLKQIISSDILIWKLKKSENRSSKIVSYRTPTFCQMSKVWALVADHFFISNFGWVSQSTNPIKPNNDLRRLKKNQSENVEQQ